MPSKTALRDTALASERPPIATQPSKKRKHEHDSDYANTNGLDDSAASQPCDISKRPYVLNRNYAATTRLNSQHLLWKLELGYSLHPTLWPTTKKRIQRPELTTSAEKLVSTISDPVRPIAEGSVRGFRIADLATGTAIWALDIAQTFPRAQIDGFDIDLQQCPPREWLPDNVSLREWDIFSNTISPELENVYDVVHIRLLLLVVQDNDPRPVLRNALRMLKSGGYLQWDELDPWGAYTVDVQAGTQRCGDGDKGGRFQEEQELTAMSTLRWVSELHDIMEEVGFEDVRREEVACDLRFAKYYQDMQFLVMEEEAGRKNTDVEQEGVKRAIEHGVQESRQGKARVTPKIVCLGRKPVATE